MKIILLLLGILSLVLGVIGIFLPVLPTTPFLLLSATLFLRSSQKLYDWLLSHPYLGEYIRNFKEHRAIPLRVKIRDIKEYAGVVELADTLDLGSNGFPCRFKSCRPYHIECS